MSHRSRICEAVENVTAFTRRDAAWLVDRIFDAVIEVLRRDPALPSRSSADWALVLADLHVRLTEQVAEVVDGRVDLEEVIHTIEAA